MSNDVTMHRCGLLMAARALKTGAATGLVVTASHNPAADNGVKLVEPTGYMLDQSWEVRSPLHLLEYLHVVVWLWMGMLDALAVQLRHTEICLMPSVRVHQTPSTVERFSGFRPVCLPPHAQWIGDCAQPAG